MISFFLSLIHFHLYSLLFCTIKPSHFVCRQRLSVCVWWKKCIRGSSGRRLLPVSRPAAVDWGLLSLYWCVIFIYRFLITHIMLAFKIILSLSTLNDIEPHARTTRTNRFILKWQIRMIEENLWLSQTFPYFEFPVPDLSYKSCTDSLSPQGGKTDLTWNHNAWIWMNFEFKYNTEINENKTLICCSPYQPSSAWLDYFTERVLGFWDFYWHISAQQLKHFRNC